VIEMEPHPTLLLAARLRAHAAEASDGATRASLLDCLLLAVGEGTQPLQAAARLIELSRAAVRAGAADAAAAAEEEKGGPERRALPRYCLRPRGPQQQRSGPPLPKRRRLQQQPPGPAAGGEPAAAPGGQHQQAAGDMVQLAIHCIAEAVEAGGQKQPLWDGLFALLLLLDLPAADADQPQPPLQRGLLQELQLWLLWSLQQAQRPPADHGALMHPPAPAGAGGAACTGPQLAHLLQLAQEERVPLEARCAAAALYADLAAAARRTGAPVPGTDNDSATAAAVSLLELLLEACAAAGSTQQQAAACQQAAAALHSLGTAFHAAVAEAVLLPAAERLIAPLTQQLPPAAWQRQALLGVYSSAAGERSRCLPPASKWPLAGLGATLLLGLLLQHKAPLGPSACWGAALLALLGGVVHLASFAGDAQQSQAAGQERELEGLRRRLAGTYSLLASEPCLEVVLTELSTRAASAAAACSGQQVRRVCAMAGLLDGMRMRCSHARVCATRRTYACTQQQTFPRRADVGQMVDRVADWECALRCAAAG
jgi:hypothetical protein